MKKIIIFIAIIMAIIAIMVAANMESTVNVNGILQEDLKTTSVDIKITWKNFYRIFNKFKGEIIVEGEDISYKYGFTGFIWEFEGYFAAPIYRNGRTVWEALGFLCYDDEMKNIVIETNRENIYAASENFIANVCN